MPSSRKNYSIIIETSAVRFICLEMPIYRSSLGYFTTRSAQPIMIPICLSYVSLLLGGP